MSSYTVSRAGKQFGPYSEEDLRAYLGSGQVLPADLVWTEGMADWLPVSRVFANGEQPVAAVGDSSVAGALPPEQSQVFGATQPSQWKGQVSEEHATTENKWFYEENGKKKGPISENEIISLIKLSTITQSASVWKHGFPDWLKIENTNLRIYFDNGSPPPLSGEHINNTFVWVLAFAPIIGYFLEWFIAGAMHGGNKIAATLAMANNKYWFVTLVLNIVLAFLDEKRLKNAGHNTDKFKGWVWLVPVYLYQRAKATKQNLAYFIVWIVCFVLVIFN